MISVLLIGIYVFSIFARVKESSVSRMFTVLSDFVTVVTSKGVPDYYYQWEIIVTRAHFTNELSIVILIQW